MRVSCQSIINTERPGQGIADLKKASLDSIMLKTGVGIPRKFARKAPKNSHFGNSESEQRAERLEKKYGLDTILERYRDTVEKCEANGIGIPVVYAPRFPYYLQGGAELNAFMEKSAEKNIELCHRIGCRYIIVESLMTDRGQEWNVNREFYVRLAQKAQGVCILLKNQYREISGHLVRGNCAEAAEAAEWVDRLNEAAGDESFGFCVDTGVCSICGNNLQEYIDELGSRVKAVILRDCDGHADMAMLPFTCAGSGTDWMGLIRGLRDIAFDGELILDFSDTAGAFSPLLKPSLYHLAKEVGDFFKWQIELEQNLKKYSSIVLFGAGNMCRNYMKNYGEMYPPLFTCDNNRKLWGTDFCGLEVKSPEALKNLPEGCGIFICNIFYREIEAQLREMGIAGHIEYFNDEYMPSFYFDRLEREE